MPVKIPPQITLPSLPNAIAPQSLETIKIIRAIGYGLLLLAIMDVFAMVIPFQFKNPLWEFQRFGELVERVAVPLIALTMIFFQGSLCRKPIERFIMSALSWLALGSGILFILLIPIAISNAQRVGIANTSQLTAQQQQQQAQVVQLEQQLSTATPQELSVFLASQGQPSENIPPPQLTQQVKAELSRRQAQLQNDFDELQMRRRQELLRDTIKWSLGALISATLFIYIWGVTAYARQSGLFHSRQIRET